MRKALSIIVLLLSFCAMFSCSNTKTKEISDKEVETEFKNSKWQKISMSLFEDLNHREFVEQNLLSPKEWVAALDFLTQKNLNELPAGRYELTENGTYANVQEYVPDTLTDFEAHKKYVDIQYVISGKEFIEYVDASDLKPTIPYDGNKDVRFYDSDNYAKKLADSSLVFIFFPNDAHKPGINAGQNDTVKKVVIKIPYSE